MSECSKIYYNTEKEAKQAARGIMSRNKNLQIWTYSCSECGGWHLTSQSPKNYRNKAVDRKLK